MRMFRTACFATATLAALSLAAGPAVAAGKPKGAKPTDPTEIFKLYAGKTSTWNSGGFAYWGAKGDYQGLSSSGDWIAGFVRTSGMTSLSGDGDLHLSAGSRQHASTQSDFSNGSTRINVRGENRVDTLYRTDFDHLASSAANLLRRLKDRT